MTVDEADRQQPITPVFRGPLLTVLILSTIVLVAHAWVESYFGGSIYCSPGPGELWAHGKIVEVPLKTWERLKLLDRISDGAFLVFLTLLLVLGILSVGQPGWYMRTKSWRWVNGSLIAGAVLTALLIVVIRAWP